MDIFELIKTRRSIRRFSDRNVEPEKLQMILDSIRHAPSWGNLQCWRILVIRDAECKNKISELSYVHSYFAPKGYKSNPAQMALTEAPVVIAFCADPSQSGFMRDQAYYLTDCGIAAQNIMLSAHALGMGTVFVGVFNETEIKKILNIPSHIRIVGLIPLGYPLKEKSAGPERKSLPEIIFQEKWTS